MAFVANRFPTATLPVIRIMSVPRFDKYQAIGFLTTATLSLGLTTIAQLLIDATCKESSIDDQNLSRYKARRIGREEHCCACQFFDLAEAFHRSAHQKLLTSPGSIEQFLVHRRTKDTWSNRVHAHTVLRPFHSQRLCERSDSCFTGGVRRHFVQRQMPSEQY